MQTRNTRTTLLFYLQIILVWIGAILLFNFLRNFGTVPDASDSPMKGLQKGQMLLILLLVGALAGIVYGSIELLFDRSYFQRHSYGRIILGKLVVTFFSVKIIMALTLLATNTMKNVFMEPQEVVLILRSKMYWVLFVYFLLVAALVSFVRMVDQKFGPGILWNMFIGRYRNPREEKRVFMFLDLQSSTTIAEKLGHIKFSRLIQNCFADLTPVITMHKVEIYQYVGDEAVLSWPVEKGFENNHCIHCYFDYMDVLKSKAEYYEETYGLQPFFKAGVHLGEVIVAEVGLVKREIAYHGDVLNTTARIQSQCNRLQQPLLISDQLLSYLQTDENLESQRLGEELLKGKETPVTIYGVSRV
ncbi:MAG: adenylate/guanylate cyclase domain-containing protein [Bacteroidota bacterium]